VLDDGRVVAGGTVDHIDPQSGRRRGVGGLHDWLNYIGACESCNRAKGSDTLLVFLVRRAGGRMTMRDGRRSKIAPACPPGRRRGRIFGPARACGCLCPLSGVGGHTSNGIRPIRLPRSPA
jgi:hypothetical protein